MMMELRSSPTCRIYMYTCLCLHLSPYSSWQVWAESAGVEQWWWEQVEAGRDAGWLLL